MFKHKDRITGSVSWLVCELNACALYCRSLVIRSFLLRKVTDGNRLHVHAGRLKLAATLQQAVPWQRQCDGPHGVHVLLGSMHGTCTTAPYMHGPACVLRA